MCNFSSTIISYVTTQLVLQYVLMSSSLTAIKKCKYMSKNTFYNFDNYKKTHDSQHNHYDNIH